MEKSQKQVLVVTAHPDDETLWFSSVIHRNDADVVCVTCGDTQNIRIKRESELKKASRLLGVNNLTVLYHNDIFRRRLDIKRLENELQPFVDKGYTEVYTHGIYGDTNEHFHHQDVSYVVHKLFDHVYSTAWNLYPDITNQLTPEEYRLKKYLMGTVYADEYRKLKTTYEISAVEKFVQLSKETVEIFYWSIANFGDNHQKLGQYRDIWGYKQSKYELQRHRTIEEFVRETNGKTVLEIAAHEGELTRRLSSFADVECTEKAEVYKVRLQEYGFKVVECYDTTAYDVVVIASVLEYVENPIAYIEQVNSRFIVLEMNNYIKQHDDIVDCLQSRYVCRKKQQILPVWEKMYRDQKEEKLEVYRLGCCVYLFELREDSNIKETL